QSTGSANCYPGASYSQLNNTSPSIRPSVYAYYHYPDGRKELRLNGTLLPYSTYDRLSEIDQGAIVDNKRLGRTLEFISLVQSKRDNTRSQSIPAGDGPSRRRPKQEGKKSQRSLDNDDMLEALKQLQSRSEDIFGKRAR
ncbi:hypothetical protein ACEWFD_25815, partial [Klebsiella pneumoniae]